MHDKTLSAVGFARARRGRAAELGDILVAIAERSRTEVGCLGSLVHRDLADPDLFVCYERWASEEAVAGHLAQPYLKEFLDRLMDCLEQDLDVHRLRLAGPAPAPDASDVRDVRDGPTDPDDPAETNARYVAAYNARDIDAVMAVYAPGASAVREPGTAVTGAAHRQAVLEFFRNEPRLSAEVRERYVVGDIASLVVDWSIEVPGAPEMSGSGRGLDVLRRNERGQWRYVVTNPFGTV